MSIVPRIERQPETPGKQRGRHKTSPPYQCLQPYNLCQHQLVVSHRGFFDNNDQLITSARWSVYRQTMTKRRQVRDANKTGLALPVAIDPFAASLLSTLFSKCQAA